MPITAVLCWMSLRSGFSFVFTRDSIHATARICNGNSVRPSVCLSVCHTRACIKTAGLIIEILSLSVRPIILVFRHQELSRKYARGAEYNGIAIFDQYAAISQKRYEI